MTNDVISCDAKENVRRLEQLMTEHQVRHIPFMDEGVLCAVVNVLDLVRYRMQSAEKRSWSASGLCFWGCLKGFRCLRVLAGFCCPHHFSFDDALVGPTE